MSLPAPLQSFLHDLRQAWKVRKDDARHLASVVKGDSSSHSQLQSSLRQLGNKAEYSQVVAKEASIPSPERANAFFVSLLEYVSKFDDASELGKNAGRGEESLLRLEGAYAKWADVYTKASLVFQAQESPFFGPTLRYVGTTLILLAIATDDCKADTNQSCVTDAVSKISRSTGIAAIDRSPFPGEKTKRAEVLWLANASFRCYFKLKNVRLCETVLGSVENALSLNRNFAGEENKTLAREREGEEEDSGMSCYCVADRVAYKYYLGRLRLSQHRIRKAYTELRWAFDHCTNANMHNKRLILTHLVVASLILGIYPTPSLLVSASLDGPFQNLIESIRRGNGYQVDLELERWRDWHRKRGNFLLLKEKLAIGIWRNLMRRSFLIARLSAGIVPQSNGKSPPPILKLSAFLPMARLAWHDPTLEIDDVECVVASLIDQGYLKGYVQHSTGNVVLRRTDDFGFPKMSGVC
ncbi:hypothetical protein CBS101457_000670 [Exobasidium rhododendri]|nr:hypothetical protein CBS101457_000670 [Exobasidium rhododendri]